MSNYLDWQNKISSDRKIVPLFYIADFSISPVDKIVKEEEEKVNLCNYTDVYKNTYITSDLEFMEGSASENEINRFQIYDGDVLITKDSESWDDIGIPAIVVGNFQNTTLCGYHLALMRPKKNLVNPKFLFYCFESKKHRTQLEIEATGVTRFGIPKDAIGKYKIPLPSLELQNKIVEYLDREIVKIDSLIEKKTKLIALLEEKKKTVINEAVTNGLDTTVTMKNSGIEWLGKIPKHWEVVKLKYFIDINYGLSQPPEYFDTGTPLIRATNIFRGKISKKDMVFIDADQLKSNKKIILKKGDIIIVRSGAYTADSAIIDEEFENSIAGFDMVIRSKNDLFSNFLAYVLLSDYMLNRQLIPMRIRAAQPHLNAEEVGSTTLIKPSLEEQKLIVQKLETFFQKNKESINLINNSINLLKEKRTTIISAAINGEIAL
ncbi:Restriction modification system DNA specificity domain protein [Flavobacterium anhuiense]|uniref:Restriction modification system DNA specificity domain protein n=1 Tax=Flavobacterium anhuiense TaxID=459526 RepID=A0A444W1G5_9FLAO|nr:restriction endonuclease subunit S [Flavobacterium anhuiense]RYJ39653.1 Restriction modification system DNA specificity domain protein [Flavobacterium anhuiense]